MGKIEATIKSEIQRLAKKEIRSTFLPMKREMRSLRLKLSMVAKNIKAFDRLAKEKILPLAGEKKLESSPEEVKTARLTAPRIRRLRLKLGLSQRELASLIGASMGAVVMWEKGKFRPKADKKGALIALRRLGKRQVRKMLAERGNGNAPEKKASKPRKRTAPRKGTARKKRAASRR